MSDPGGQSWLSQGALAVLGTGSAFPGPAIDSETLLDRIEGGFGPMPRRAALAVARRLGIRTRHVARDWTARGEGPRAGSSNPDLAAAAVRGALAQAGIDVGDLGFLIGHTATPAQPLPANIVHVADRLGYRGPHLELRQACTGFASALTIAFGLLARADARPVAIVGSDVGSVFFDPARIADDHGQRVNLMQMGDGAGAVILGPAATAGSSITAAWFGATGLGRSPGLQMRRGGSDAPGMSGVLDADHDFAAILASGPALFDAGLMAAARHGVSSDAVDWIVPHQVSGRIGAQLAGHMNVPESRFFVNADRVGNTGSAAIWIALDALRARGLASASRTLVLGAEATKFMHGGFVYVH